MNKLIIRVDPRKAEEVKKSLKNMGIDIVEEYPGSPYYLVAGPYVHPKVFPNIAKIPGVVALYDWAGVKISLKGEEIWE